MTRKTQGRDQLVKEARIGLPILGLLFLVFIFTAYRRMSGWADAPPANIPAPQQLNSASQGNASGSADTGNSSSGSLSKPAEIRRPTQSRPKIVPPTDGSRPGTLGNPAPNGSGQNQPLIDPIQNRRNLPLDSSPRSLPDISASRLGTPDLSRQTSTEQMAGQRPESNQPTKSLNGPPSDELTQSFSRSNEANTSHTLENQASSTTNSFAPPRGPSLVISQPPARFNSESAGRLNPIPSETNPTSARSEQRDSSAVIATLNTRRDESAQLIEATDNQSNPYSIQRTAATEPISPVREFRVEVLGDDSYWSLAERAYGSGQWFRLVHAWLQQEGLGDRWQNQKTVVLPAREILAASFPSLATELGESVASISESQTTLTSQGESARSSSSTSGSSTQSNTGRSTYRTRGGETLFELAAHFLNQAARYNEIAALNRDQLSSDIGPNSPLPAELTLVMPAVK